MPTISIGTGSIPATSLAWTAASRLAISLRVVAVHDEVGLGRPDRERGQRDAVHHQVRDAAEQQPVLAAGRLAFRAVGDDDGRTGGLRRPSAACGRSGIPRRRGRSGLTVRRRRSALRRHGARQPRHRSMRRPAAAAGRSCARAAFRPGWRRRRARRAGAAAASRGAAGTPACGGRDDGHRASLRAGIGWTAR